jgi:hypothetical protein
MSYLDVINKDGLIYLVKLSQPFNIYFDQQFHLCGT